MFRALRILNRHALFFVPMVALVFLTIAGLIGRSYGFHNLFRDFPGEDVSRIPYFFVTSTAFQIQTYATALMGLMWTIEILIFELEEEPPNTHPILRAKSVVWPGVALLSLIPLVANQVAINDVCNIESVYCEQMRWHLTGLLYSLLGVGFGLLIVSIAVNLAVWSSMRLRYPQIVTVGAVTCALLVLVTYNKLLMPGFAFFVVLSWFVLIYALLTCCATRYRFWLFLGIVALGLSGSVLREFKHQFDGLETYYKSAADRPQLDTVTPGAALIKPLDSLDAWRRHFTAKHGSDTKPIFVVVAASGGGYRAAYWSAKAFDYLTKLSRENGLAGLDDSLGLLTGASGGMVAAAYFVAGRADDEEHDYGQVEMRIDRDLDRANEGTWLSGFFRNARRDSLTPVIQQLVQQDFLPFAYFPFESKMTDRGQTLERQWVRLNVTFTTLLNQQRKGWAPAIIFAPFLVDSGKALLISNLDLSEITSANSHTVEFFRLFPVQDRFTLATAARMSASFPYIAPAVSLPTNPPQRVVDAGYFDNDGVAIAASFLELASVRSWLKANAAGVMLIRINAFPEDGRQEEACSEKDDDNNNGEAKNGGQQPQPNRIATTIANILPRIKHGFRWITSPVEGAWVARTSSARFANALEIASLKDAYRQGDDPFLEDIEIANGTFASESWHLPAVELSDMKKWLSGECHNPDAQRNTKALERLIAFWRTRIKKST